MTLNDSNTAVKPRMRQTSAMPTRKLAYGGLAGALTTIIVYVLFRGAEMTDAEKALTGAIEVLVMLVVGYLVPPARRDEIVAAN